MRNILVHQRFNRQEIDNSHCNSYPTGKYPQKIPDARPNDRNPGFQ
jgi:hypothetical protein